MYKTKLQALGFHSIDLNVEEQKHFRNLVCWLEDQKINHYSPEERKSLRNTSSKDWEMTLQKYLNDLNCPYTLSELTLLIHWLLSFAVRVEYQKKGKPGQPILQANNPLESMDFTSEEFKTGLNNLASSLQIPTHPDATIVLKAIRLLIRNNLTKTAVDSLANTKGMPLIPMSQVDLGFETKDLILEDAAKILRLCYVQEMRELQDLANQAIVACQAITANPKTDTKLGKVGRG